MANVNERPDAPPIVPRYNSWREWKPIVAQLDEAASFSSQK